MRNPTDRYAGVPVFFLVVMAVCLAGPASVRAQATDRAAEFEDLGMVRPPDVSARAASLGSFVSTISDATALIYNPAGLCRIKKRTPLLGIARSSFETVTDYGGNPTGLSSKHTGLQFMGAAFSIPVFQGSLVPAVAIYRAFASDLDLAYDANNTIDDRIDAFRLQQSGSTFAFSIGVGIDLSSAISAGVAMSVYEGGYHALRQSHSRFQEGPLAVERYVVDDIDGDLDGISARGGVVLYAHRHLHIGATVSSPTLLNGSTHGTQEVTRVVQNSTGSTTRSDIASSTEYIIPYRVDGSIAFPLGSWLITGQVGYCDWSAAAIDKEKLRIQNGDAVLGKAVDLRAGIEWTAPSLPLRVRASVARLPYAPDYIQADRVDNDRLEAAMEDTVPLRFGVGAGIALKDMILIDAAFTHTRGERSTVEFTEKRTYTQFLIEGSYWF